MTEHAHDMERPAAGQPILRQIQKGGIILLGLLTLAAVGIAFTQINPAKALWYWIAMAPVFGGVCVYLEWSRSTRKPETAPFLIVRRQVFHWIGFLAAVYLVFLLHSTGRMTAEVAGLVALFTLAVSTLFAGIHGDWRIGLVGVVLGLTVAGAALVQQILWLLLLPLAVAAVLGFLWWRSRRAPPSGEAGSRGTAPLPGHLPDPEEPTQTGLYNGSGPEGTGPGVLR